MIFINYIYIYIGCDSPVFVKRAVIILALAFYFSVVIIIIVWFDARYCSYDLRLAALYCSYALFIPFFSPPMASYYTTLWSLDQHRFSVSLTKTTAERRNMNRTSYILQAEGTK